MNDNKTALTAELTSRIYNAVAGYTQSSTDGVSGEVILNALIAASALVIRNICRDNDEFASFVAESFAKQITNIVLEAPRDPGLYKSSPTITL